MRRLRAVLLVVVVAGVVGGAAGATLAAFTGTTDNSASTFSAKRVSSTQRSTSAWKVSDASSGTAADRSAPMSYYNDGLYYTTSSISATWSTSRYVELEFAADAPEGLTPTAVDLNIDYADDAGGGGEVSCFYVEVRRKSTGAVLATRGSSGSPLSCESTTTVRQTSTSLLPEVTDGTIANDLQVRLYVQNAGGADPMRLDRTTVTFTRYGKTWTLNRTKRVDAANGTPVTNIWEPVGSGDGYAFQTAGNWATSFSATRYVDVTFPPNVPGGSTVSGAQFRHAYRSATAGDTTCWYAEIYSGTTLLATKGSSASPISCNATTSYVTDTVSIPEVDTGTEASNLRIRIYARNTGSRKSQHDLIAFDATWGLGSTGCADAGSTTLTPVADSWTDQNAPTSTTGGTATELRVKSQNGSRNRRSYLRFSLPSAPEGCTVTGATLRLNSTATQGTRTLEVYRAGASWTEAALNWNNQPATTGTAVTTSNGLGWLSVNVLAHVQALYSGTNNGFVVKDSAEDAATAAEQRIASRENATPSELVVTFG